MTELRRWSEEGARTEETLLLETSRHECAPAPARARTLQALGVAVAASTATTGTAVAAAHAGAKSALTYALKIAALSLVGTGIVAGAVAAVHASRVRTGGASLVDSRGPVPPPSIAPPMEAASAADPPSSGPAAVALAPAGRPDRPPARASASADPLPREVKALEAVHEALLSRDPDAAIRLLDRYQTQFPHGSLSSEATVLRVQALLASGDRAGAQALVDGYSSAHADGPYVKRLRELVRGK